MISMCRIVSCVVGRGRLLWPVRSLGKTLLAFALLHFVLKVQIRLLLQVSWLSTFAFWSPMMKKDIFWGVLVLEGLVGLHRTVQLQLLQHSCLGHRLGLLWYWMVCLGDKPRSFCCFWDCTQVLGFPDSSVGKESACNAGGPSLIPGLGRSPGEGKGYPLQYSGLENSMDCMVHGVAKSQTWLSTFHFHFTQVLHFELFCWLKILQARLQ